MAESGRTGDARVVTMHPGQLKVGLDTVRQLVDEQFPQWRSLPIEQLLSPGPERLFRIGEHLAARFPLPLRILRRPVASLSPEVRAASRASGPDSVPNS